MRFEDVLERLEPLPDPLPAGPASLMPLLHDTGGSRPVPGLDVPLANARPAAVLILLFPDDAGDAHFVVTERTDRGGHHSGEVSFPGGRAEPDDADEVATALREAAEEVGLDPTECGLHVIGRLPGLWVPVSNFSVTPIVAVAARRPTMRRQPSEVAAIVDLPVAAILPGARLVPRERTFHDARLTYDAYPIDELPGASPGLVIWGMTARVLGGLGAWLADESERPPMVDELTGLRQYGDLRLPHLVRRRTAPWLELMRDGVALVAIDVHGFRAVNDRRGFGVGNAALREIGRRILATAGDLPAWRVSGDGFVVAMPDGGVAAAGALAERLRDEIRLPIHDPEAMDTGEVVLVEARFAVMEPGAGADLAQSLNALEYAVDVIARQPGEIVIASL